MTFNFTDSSSLAYPMRSMPNGFTYSHVHGSSKAMSNRNVQLAVWSETFVPGPTYRGKWSTELSSLLESRERVVTAVLGGQPVPV